MEENLYDTEEYPYYQIIKKLLYSFGDTYKNETRTVIYMHDFMKKWLISLNKIIAECEYKKIMDHLYSYEFSKFYNYKKLKFKNCIKNNNNENDNDNENESNDILKNKDYDGINLFILSHSYFIFFLFNNFIFFYFIVFSFSFIFSFIFYLIYS
jgi:hypothetical protein